MPAAHSREVTVVAGDTLEAIASTYGVSLEALIKANGIEDPSRLQIGQKLLLPKPALGGSTRAQPAPRGSEAFAPPPPPGSDGSSAAALFSAPPNAATGPTSTCAIKAVSAAGNGSAPRRSTGLVGPCIPVECGSPWLNLRSRMWACAPPLPRPSLCNAKACGKPGGSMATGAPGQRPHRARSASGLCWISASNTLEGPAVPVAPLP